MQGRLSPRPADRLQAFPHETWPDELAIAKRVGLDFVEWIYEAPRARENPLASEAGRRAIVAACAASGTPIGSVCADYFMVRKLAGGSCEERAENVSVLAELIRWTREIGASRILLPLLETSALSTPALVLEASDSLRQVTRVLEYYDVTLGLEMEIAGPEYAAVVRGVGHGRVRAYYDTGNSTAQGFDVGQDISDLLPLLTAVHLKDRRTHGSSVPLGSGDTNFAGLFARLRESGFAGDFLLQHYFDDDPEGAAREALGVVRGLWPAAEAAA
ncbi:MAG TPA: sugar phosphate isomerase/epimerase family protein [Polyangiaceae bacterium]